MRHDCRWASESEIAGLFTEHARLIGQDKQVTVGKAAVLKRLDQGRLLRGVS